MDGIVVLFVAGFLLVGLVLVTVMYQWYLGTKTFTAVILALLALGAGGGFALWEYGTGRSFPRSELVRQRMYELGLSHDNPIPGVAMVLLGLMVTALLAKFYLTWLQGKFILNENATGWLGFRSWLRPVNVMLVVGIAICLYLGLGYELRAILAVVIILLAALCGYPLSKTLSGERGMSGGGSGGGGGVGGGPAEREGELAEERRRVLALVEAGKVSAEDGAELITALGQSHAVMRAQGQNQGVSGSRRLMLLGGALVLVGFFLPWYQINVTQSMRTTMQGFSSIWGGVLPGMQNNLPTSSTFSEANRGGGVFGGSQSGTDLWLTFRGGDFNYGLGWWILILGLGAAVLPFIWPTTRGNQEVQRGVTLLACCAGVIVLLYLLVNVISYAGIGLITVAVAYLILGIGAVREYLRPAAPRLMAPVGV